jgi:hypothetical protein
MPPTSVSCGSIFTRLSSCTERPINDMPAPYMMLSGETLLLRWLITSDSANTVHTPEIDAASVAERSRPSMSAVS